MLMTAANTQEINGIWLRVVLKWVSLYQVMKPAKFDIVPWHLPCHCWSKELVREGGIYALQVLKDS